MNTSPKDHSLIQLKLTKMEQRFLLALAVFGALLPNGVFLYWFFTSPETAWEALSNPVSLVFISEAFVLMALFAWLLKKTEPRGVTAATFVAMSLLGTMVFSIPASLYMLCRRKIR